MLNNFKDNHIFNEVSEEYLDSLETECNEVFIEMNNYLFKQGDPGRGMYIIVDGEIDIFVDTDKDGEQCVARLKPGATLGEISLLDRQKRIASAKAKKDSRLLYLDIKKFSEHIKNKNPEALRIVYNISLTMVDRLEKANSILIDLQSHAEPKKIQREVSHYKAKLLDEGLF